MRSTETYIWIKTRFEGFHRWPDAPIGWQYLAHTHRHEFHVCLSIRVNHDNREVEFIRLKEQVNAYIDENFAGWDNRSDRSCEQMAKLLLEAFDAAQVDVSEDGENGATVFAIEEE